MWSYQVQSTFGRIVWASLAILTSLVPFTGAFGSNSVSGTIFAFVIGVAFFGWGLLGLREVVRIDITEDGTVMFIRTMDTTPLHVGTIQRLEGWSREHYGKRTWFLSVYYRTQSERRIVLKEFPAARAFANRIEQLNPSVRFLGEWPVPPP